MAKDLIQLFIPPEPPTKGMSQRHVKFVDEIILRRGDKAAAYLASGYKVKNRDVARRNASRLLKNARVQRLLQFRLEQARRKANVEVWQAQVIEELNRLAYSSLLDVARWDENGLTVINSDQLTPEAAACIKKLRMTKTVIPQKDGDPIERINIDLEMHDKRGALDLLARASNLVDHQKPPASVSISLNFAPSKNKRQTEQPTTENYRCVNPQTPPASR